jgi:hypothetical protein
MYKDPKGNGLTDIKLIWNREEDGLPVNLQEGTTCGIYALHAATKVLNKPYAPPPPRKQEGRLGGDPDWRQKWERGGSIPAERPVSIRSIAKKGPDPLSKIGEINGVDDMHKLAAKLGIASQILTFSDVNQLWVHIVNSIKAGHAIVFPYTAANSLGEVAGIKKPDDFTHWTLLCGYSESQTSRFVFMNTYGGYHKDHVLDLFNSNMAIQDWSAQKWIKVTLWIKDGAEDWKRWKNEWLPDLDKEVFLLSMAEGAKQDKIGFAIGTKGKRLYTLFDPGSPSSPPAPIPKSLPDYEINRAVEFRDMPYKANMAGKCIVVK